MRRKRVYIFIICAITLLAFLIRLWIAYELYENDPTVTRPSTFTDMHTYLKYSRDVLSGSYEGLFYYQPFYYAIFLPVVFFFIGIKISGVIFIQVILSSATVYITGITAGNLFGRRAGICAAGMACFSSMLILYIPYMLIATLQSFWIALICYLSTRYIDKSIKRKENHSATRSCVALGFICGLAILTRGNIWFFVPGIVVMIGYLCIFFRNAKDSILKSFLPLTMFIIFIILPQIPFIYHNSKILGKLCGPSTAAHAVLSIGNTPQSSPGGRDPGTGAGPMEYSETYDYWTKNTDKSSVIERILEWLYANPLGFMEFQFRKLLLFWDYREIPNNISIEGNGLRSKVFITASLLNVKKMPSGTIGIANNFIPFSALLLITGLSGLLLYILKLIEKKSFFSVCSRSLLRQVKSHPSIYMLLYFSIAYWFATAAFYNLGRFRVPLLPILAIFSGGYIQYAIDCTKRRKNIARLILVLTTAIFIVMFSYDIYRYSFEKSIIKYVRPNGTTSNLGDKFLIEDNGPMSFGSWHLISLGLDKIYKKKFIVPQKMQKGANCLVSFPLICSGSGKAVISVNGTDHTITFSKAERKTHVFRVENCCEIILKLKESDRAIYILGDYQRDYNRTLLNGVPQPYELVMRIYICPRAE